MQGVVSPFDAGTSYCQRKAEFVGLLVGAFESCIFCRRGSLRIFLVGHVESLVATIKDESTGPSVPLSWMCFMFRP